MTDQAVTSTDVQSGDTPPAHVSAEEYLANYAHDHYEWDNGELIKMSPITEEHFQLAIYLTFLLHIYFDYRPIGVMRSEPFLMQVDAVGLKREPDLQIILNDNPGKLTRTAMLGPADICIEIVSPESIERDFVTKLKLYEEAGVREYWILDYEREGSHFYRLNEAGKYILHRPEGDIYESPLLPDLKLDIATLWVRPYPKVAQIMDAVRAMLGEA
jgi:Uma2 family endonuclease